MMEEVAEEVLVIPPNSMAFTCTEHWNLSISAYPQT